MEKERDEALKKSFHYMEIHKRYSEEDAGHSHNDEESQ